MRTSKETIDYIMSLAKLQNISQRELAEKVGISESTLSRYANYSREFPINDIGRFADALGTHVSDLLDIPFPKDNVFPLAEGMVMALKDVGALNSETVRNEAFRERLFRAMIKDLEQLAKR